MDTSLERQAPEFFPAFRKERSRAALSPPDFFPSPSGTVFYNRPVLYRIYRTLDFRAIFLSG